VVVFTRFLRVWGAPSRQFDLHRVAAVKAQVEPGPEGGSGVGAGTVLAHTGAVDNATGWAARRQGALIATCNAKAF